MRIEKFKFLKNNKYKVIIDDHSYVIHGEIIVKHNLLGEKSITEEELEECIAENLYYIAYQQCLNYICARLRSEKEVRDHLFKKGYNKDIIDKTIEKLYKNKLLDNDAFAKAYVLDQINLRNVGPDKIRKSLENFGVSSSIIEKNIVLFKEKTQREKIEKWIKKEVKANTKKSEHLLKNKILVDLISKGFERELVLEYLRDLRFNDRDILEKEREKAYKKYSNKYSGEGLEYKVRSYLYQKGFKL